MERAEIQKAQAEINAESYARDMTKRERIAMTLMQGMLANEKYDPPRRTKLDLMAQDAAAAADALLEQLEQ